MNSLIQPIAGLVIRHGLTLVAGVLFARYSITVDASLLDAIAAGGAAGAAVAWSVVQKLRARKG